MSERLLPAKITTSEQNDYELNKLLDGFKAQRRFLHNVRLDK